jgi:hypothetical protein
MLAGQSFTLKHFSCPFWNHEKELKQAIEEVIPVEERSITDFIGK